MEANPVDATVFDPALAVADAIMYEGYLLYPYRRSSIKNRFRWQFGVLFPQAWAQARDLDDTGVAGAAEGWWQQTECLLQTAEDPGEVTVHCRVRFLRLLARTVEEQLPDGTHRAVDRLRIGARLELGFDEASPRDFDLRIPLGELLAGERRRDFGAPGSADVEALADEAGHPVGRVLSRRWPVAASVAVSAVRCPSVPGLFRLRVRVENADRATSPEASRPEALRRSLIATHSLLTAGGASFVSLLDPPDSVAAEARACSNVHTFPVLGGEPGTRDIVLSSPIVLYDHPRIAPESPGDLYDATEIDELLSMRTRMLTDAEKGEARATDPRAAAIVDRVDAMPPEILSRLHGVIRRPSPAGAVAVDGTYGGHLAEPADVAEPADRTYGADDDAEPPSRWVPPVDPSPGADAVVVAGTRVSKGSRVRLRPRPSGTDPQDMFLAGRIARVEAVLVDMDGSHHLAVTVEGDPGAELDRWYGRFRYFSPTEVEPMADTGSNGGCG